MSKLRRNRWAMVSTAVIGVYVAIALMIFAIEGVQWFGSFTGWYSIADRPVAGMFLAGSQKVRVGPKNLAGFGRQRDAETAANQVNDDIIKAVGPALRQAERVRTELRGRRDGHRFHAGVGARLVGFAERRIFSTDVGAVRVELEAAEEARDELESMLTAQAGLRQAQSSASELLADAQALRELEATFLETDEPSDAMVDEVMAAREDLAFTMLDVAESLEKAAAQSDTIGDLGVEIMDRADEIEVGEAGEAYDLLPDDTLIERLDGALAPLIESLQPSIDAKRDELIDAGWRLMPRPTGFEGLVYRFRTLLGTDQQGRSVLVRGIYSAKIAIQVGVVVALFAVLFGTLMGAAAAFFGGWVDNAIMWIISVLSSIPYLVLLAVIAFVARNSGIEIPWEEDKEIGETLIPLYIAMGSTFWLAPARVIRGEAMKIKELEYIQAATAIGFSRFYILLKHLVPNTTHLMFINFSLLFIGAVKNEVILTFLGLGLKDGASWGIMISQSRPEVLNGFLWQIGGATFFMFGLVLAFNILTDALQDAFDPKHVG